VLWIRIRNNQHHFDNLDPHPDLHNFGNLDPHLYQIKIRIRIKIYKLDPEPDTDSHQFADVKPKYMEYEPILALFQGFELFLDPDPDTHLGESRIRIRIN
jgi:hypothetical protein